MKKKKIIRKTKIAIMSLLIFLGIARCAAFAQTGTGKVYKKDSLLTPSTEEVVLTDLDGSGYLKNPYLNLLILAGSPYDYRAYSPYGNFVYEPVEWDYYNTSEEGIKFDQVSLYYYLTLMRHYFESHFGFMQSWDGVNIENVDVFCFKEGIIPYAGNEALFFSVPGDPQIDFAPNFYRGFSVVMHEYAHLIFHRYRQKLQFQWGTNDEPKIINEGLAIFWPCTIMDEPRYGRTMSPPGMEPNLEDDFIYDPDSPDILGNGICALTSALWNLREHPRVGKTNTENLLYEAMALIPHENAMLADVTGTLVIAKETLPQEIKDNLHDKYIVSTFAKHNIPMRKNNNMYFLSLIEKENNLPEFIRPGETKNITIKLKNKSPVNQNASLISFNPNLDPNVDNSDIVTSYSWGIENPILPLSSPILPGEEAVFNFNITAAQNPGVYACDWAQQTNGQIGCIVSKNILVKDIEEFTVGSTDSAWTTSSYSALSSAIRVDENITMHEFKQYIEMGGNSSQKAVILKWTGTGDPSNLSEWEVILDKDLGMKTAGTEWYSSGMINVNLEAGNWYWCAIYIPAGVNKTWYRSWRYESNDFWWGLAKSNYIRDNKNFPTGTLNYMYMNDGRLMHMKYYVSGEGNDNPVINHTPIISAPDYQDITFSAVVTDNNPGIEQVTLYWRKRVLKWYGWTWSDLRSEEMVCSGANLYETVLTASQTGNRKIKYYITAKDYDGNSTTTPTYIIERP